MDEGGIGGRREDRHYTNRQVMTLKFYLYLLFILCIYLLINFYCLRSWPTASQLFA